MIKKFLAEVLITLACFGIAANTEAAYTCRDGYCVRDSNSNCDNKQENNNRSDCR